MRVSAIASLALVFLCACGCRDSGVIPYNAPDVRYLVDVNMGSLVYDDDPVEIHRDLWVLSTEHDRTMLPPTGTFDYVYALTTPSGQRHEYRQEKWNAGQWVGDLKEMPGGPQYLPPGAYKLTVAVTTPDGKHVAGNFTRDFTVRSRETAIDLVADKASYSAGETITLTVWLTNLMDQPITFPGSAAQTSLLTVNGDWLDLKGTPLPKKLDAGQKVQWQTLTFTAGKSDPRFKIGARMEWFPAPFGRKGKCEMQVSLSAKAVVGDAPVAAPTHVAARAGRLAIDVTSILAHE